MLLLNYDFAMFDEIGKRIFEITKWQMVRRKFTHSASLMKTRESNWRLSDMNPLKISR